MCQSSDHPRTNTCISNNCSTIVCKDLTKDWLFIEKQSLWCKNKKYYGKWNWISHPIMVTLTCEHILLCFHRMIRSFLWKLTLILQKDQKRSLIQAYKRYPCQCVIWKRLCRCVEICYILSFENKLGFQICCKTVVE